MAAKKQYEVIVALAIAKTPEGGDLYLYHGSPVPDGIDEKEVARLLEGEFIAEVSKPVEEPSTDDKAAADKAAADKKAAEAAAAKKAADDKAAADKAAADAAAKK